MLCNSCSGHGKNIEDQNAQLFVSLRIFEKYEIEIKNNL